MNDYADLRKRTQDTINLIEVEQAEYHALIAAGTTGDVVDKHNKNIDKLKLLKDVLKALEVK